MLAIETAARGRSESFFLQQSLAAGENNQHALTLKTAGSVNPTELDRYQVVIINDASGVNDGLASALKAFVERGGALIIAAAKHTTRPTSIDCSVQYHPRSSAKSFNRAVMR